MPNCCVEREHLLLELDVAEAAAELVAVARQRVEVARRRELRGLQRELGRRAADHEREVVRRARGGAERAQLLVEPAHQADSGLSSALVSWNSRLLFAEPPPLAMNSSLYVVAVDRLDLDLGGQVRAGVLLVVHVERRELRVAQVVVGVRAEHAARDRFAVAAAREDELALLALHDRGAGVLARRQHAAGGDARVLQQLERDEAVVRRRLGIVEDRCAAARGGRAAAGARCRASPVRVSSVSASGSTSRKRRPPASNVVTKSLVSRRYGVSSAPSGNMSW